MKGAHMASWPIPETTRKVYLWLGEKDPPAVGSVIDTSGARAGPQLDLVNPLTDEIVAQNPPILGSIPEEPEPRCDRQPAPQASSVSKGRAPVLPDKARNRPPPAVCEAATTLISALVGVAPKAV